MSNSLNWNGVDLGVIVERVPWPFCAPPRDNGVELTARDGGFAGPTTYGKTTLNIPIFVEGVAQSDPAQTRRENYLSRLDTLKAALNTRAAGELYFDAQDDRYWLARFAGADDVEFISPWAGRTTLRFIADAPFAFSRTESSQEVEIASSQVSFETTAGGSAEVRPVFEIVAGASSAALVVIENEQRGERLAWGQALTAGNKLRIDSGRQVVEISPDDHDDWVSSMLKVDGIFPALAPGANSMVLYGVGAGATMTVTWRNRYL